MKISTLSIIIAFTLLFTTQHLSAQTQADMNEEAAAIFKETNLELDRVYDSVKLVYKEDPLFITNLKTAQISWFKFRDATLELKFPKSKWGLYGSVLPFCIMEYKSELTRARIKELRIWLAGADEGDVCRGSMRQN